MLQSAPAEIARIPFDAKATLEKLPLCAAWKEWSSRPVARFHILMFPLFIPTKSSELSPEIATQNGSSLRPTKDRISLPVNTSHNFKVRSVPAETHRAPS